MWIELGDFSYNNKRSKISVLKIIISEMKFLVDKLRTDWHTEEKINEFNTDR
jgi:hypothetical protein